MSEEEKALVVKEIKILTVVHLAMMAGILIFSMGVTGMNFTGVTSPTLIPADPIFRILVPAVGLMSFVMAGILYRKLVQGIPREINLAKKLLRYKNYNIIQFAIIEGGAFFAIIIYLLTNDILSFMVAGILLIGLFLVRPSYEKCRADLGL